MGRHVYYLASMDELTNASMFFRINAMCTIVAIMLIKVSACLFLLRIMKRGTTTFLRRFLYVMTGLVVVIGLAAMFSILFACWPVAATWDPRVRGRCWTDRQTYSFAYAQGGQWEAWSEII